MTVNFGVEANDSPVPLLRRACNHLSTTTFSSNDTFDIIQKLDPNKVHSHDIICIWMLKICRKPICRPLELNECISISVRMEERQRSAHSQEKL